MERLRDIRILIIIQVRILLPRVRRFGGRILIRVLIKKKVRATMVSAPKMKKTLRSSVFLLEYLPEA